VCPHARQTTSPSWIDSRVPPHEAHRSSPSAHPGSA
jgi:hypothetical protein